METTSQHRPLGRLRVGASAAWTARGRRLPTGNRPSPRPLAPDGSLRNSSPAQNPVAVPQIPRR
eukprot:2112006-Alexandrium_andersonii.AAC.1